MYDTTNVEAESLIRFAEAYKECGWSVQEQLSDLLDGREDEVTPGAVSIMKEHLRGFCDEIDQALDAYVAPKDEEDSEE